MTGGQMTFGQLVREARRSKDLTLEVLAKKIGTNKGYISGIENGTVNPPAAKMTAKICTALGLDSDFMMMLGWAEKAPQPIREKVIRRVVNGDEFKPPDSALHKLAAVRDVVGS